MEDPDVERDALDAVTEALDARPLQETVDLYLRSYTAVMELQAQLDAATARKAAVAEALERALLQANMKSIKTTDGITVTMGKEVSYSGCGEYRELALVFVPPALHKVDSRSFSSYLKECLATGVTFDGKPLSEATLPAWITKFERYKLSVRGLRARMAANSP